MLMMLLSQLLLTMIWYPVDAFQSILGHKPTIFRSDSNNVSTKIFHMISTTSAGHSLANKNKLNRLEGDITSPISVNTKKAKLLVTKYMTIAFDKLLNNSKRTRQSLWMIDQNR